MGRAVFCELSGVLPKSQTVKTIYTARSKVDQLNFSPGSFIVERTKDPRVIAAESQSDGEAMMVGLQ
jgi:hypothetical protein